MDITVTRNYRVRDFYKSANSAVIISNNANVNSAPLSAHGSLSQLDYDTSGHTGFQASLTSGIADTNSVVINAADVAVNDYAKFTATGLLGRSYAEVMSDLGAAPLANPTFIGSGSWDSPTFYVDATNHRVGIGTAAPSQKFHLRDGYALFNNNVGNGDANSGILIVAAIATTKYNWLIGAQYNVDNGFEITPSTAVGGTTFNAPALRISYNGDLTASGEVTAAGFKSDLVYGNTAYVSGFAGAGYKLDKSGSNYSLTVDNLVVRKKMDIYELAIHKISAVNGGLMVTIANGKAYSVATPIYTAWTNGNFTTFVSSGLNITSAINTSGATYATLNTSTYYTVLAGEIITIQTTVTNIAGANTPKLIISESGGNYEYILSAGSNTITHTVTDVGSFAILVQSRNLTGGEFSLTSTSITSDIPRIYFDEDGANKLIQFAVGDYIRSQEWTGRTAVGGGGARYYLGHVIDVRHSTTLGGAFIKVVHDTGTPWDGCDLVQVGSATVGRQSMIYITASDTDNPFIDILDGVTDGDFAGHTKVRLGNLAGITDADLGGALSGYGLYSENVYLKGKIVASSGSIGGWTIASTYLKKDTGTDATSSGMAPSDYPFYSGKQYNDRNSAPFRVDVAGNVYTNGSLEANGAVSLGTLTSSNSVTIYSALRLYGSTSQLGHRVLGDETLTIIDSSLYRKDAADVAKTLTLPTFANMSYYYGVNIILLNPEKGSFTIDSNGVNVYLNSYTPVTSFILGQGESCTLYYLDTLYPGWYKL